MMLVGLDFSYNLFISILFIVFFCFCYLELFDFSYNGLIVLLVESFISLFLSDVNFSYNQFWEVLVFVFMMYSQGWVLYVDFFYNFIYCFVFYFMRVGLFVFIIQSLNLVWNWFYVVFNF